MGVASKYPSNQKEINEMNRDCFYPSRLLIQEFGKNVDRHIIFLQIQLWIFQSKNEWISPSNKSSDEKNCVE